MDEVVSDVRCPHCGVSSTGVAVVCTMLGELITQRDTLVLETARLNFELGKTQGELEGLRAGWSVSNHEAWERGAKAGLDADNPFPKPEKVGG